MGRYRIRSALSTDLPALAAANIVCWRETYGALLPADFLQGRIEKDPHYCVEHWQELLSRWRVLLVEADGTVAGPDRRPQIDGFILFGDSSGALPQFDAQIEKLYLRKSAQRAGLGRALMRAAARDLLQQGRRSLIVWLIDWNEPAQRFYRRLGGVRVGEPQAFTIAGVPLHEIAFGWPSLLPVAAGG
jgi:ribosomal protein S18 acetylase RimI-like enzyme